MMIADGINEMMIVQPRQESEHIDPEHQRCNYGHQQKPITALFLITLINLITSAYGYRQALLKEADDHQSHVRHVFGDNFRRNNNTNLTSSIWENATKIVHGANIIGMSIMDSERKNSPDSAKDADDSFGEGKMDCRTQRERAMLKLENNPENGNYIPTCTGENDILYDRTQCHRLSHICWCVNPESGIPLAGTSKYNAKPICNGNNSTNIGGIRREIKGCIGKKKAKFYQRLFSSLISEWIITLGDDADDDAINSKDSAVRWKFEQLDTNNNSLLERKEWKPYRYELRLFNKVRKCGRNFMRFCDANSNKQVTLEEWLDCTVNVDTTIPRAVPPAKTKYAMPRKNPFLDILRPDD